MGQRVLCRRAAQVGLVGSAAGFGFGTTSCMGDSGSQPSPLFMACGGALSLAFGAFVGHAADRLFLAPKYRGRHLSLDRVCEEHGITEENVLEQDVANRCAALAEAITQPTSHVMPEGLCDGINGRVVYGKTEADFADITGGNSEGIGTEELKALRAKMVYWGSAPRPHMELMEAVGLKAEWVEKRLADGDEFRIIVYPNKSFKAGQDSEIQGAQWATLYFPVAMKKIHMTGKMQRKALFMKKKEVNTAGQEVVA